MFMKEPKFMINQRKCDVTGLFPLKNNRVGECVRLIMSKEKEKKNVLVLLTVDICECGFEFNLFTAEL